MGNALRFLYAHCCKPTVSGESESLGPHGVSTTSVGVSALAHDLFNFEINSQVPEGLSNHVVSSKKAQANWYRKLSEAWREAKPPPKTPEEASRLIIQTLKKHQKADVEGLLAFYGLPLPHALLELSAGVPTSLPHGVKFELQTLPVDARAIPDGDGMTVYVSTTDPRESSCLPLDVQMAAVQRSQARAERNYERADELHQQIIDSGYRLVVLISFYSNVQLIGTYLFFCRVISVQNQEVLARKYRIRLMGIDAPESSMPYGQEAKQELIKLIRGKSVRIFVYTEDRYGRLVGDVHCNGIFVQEALLKKGCAWHYTAYDQRVELASWEKEARLKRTGLWAAPNPEEPWEWRKDRREGRQ
ncbi:hypothetical protein K2173_005035 [Erythroxylum novogranatense]|uniref:TNase-like domain-containing protein n=1 Tax=Erythroxylum novogranatense TaxID=1862640 RepID=A0AAV8TDQ1_9ROSI|nr:hypothetical protein K2173_005035 [Erythroxylum novogranatense]